MDYNEMAIHFDKMVRKHSVHRVLTQARQMYSDYLKLHQNDVDYYQIAGSSQETWSQHSKVSLQRRRSDNNKLSTTHNL